MRVFLGVLIRHKRILQEQLFTRRLALIGRYVIVPAGILLFVAWWLNARLPFLFGLALPLLAIIWLKKAQTDISIAHVARFIDAKQGLNDMLTTAHEFEPRHKESPILSALMDEADRQLQSLEFTQPPKRERLEPLILITLFLVLLLLNILSFKDRSDDRVHAILNAIKSFQGDLRERYELERMAKDIKNATSKDERQQATQRLQQAIDEADPIHDLRQAGKALSNCRTTERIGNPLSQGSLERAAKSAEILASQLESGLPSDQIEPLRQALDEAQRRLQHPATQDLRAAIQTMRNNVQNLERLQQATRQMAKELNQLAQRQKSLQSLKEKLSGLQPSLRNASNKESSIIGFRDTMKPAQSQSTSDMNSGIGNETATKSGSGRRPDNGNRPGFGTSTGFGSNSSSSDNADSKQHNGRESGTSTSSGQNQPKPQKTANTGSNMNAGGKQAGGQVTQDPQKIVKEGKGQKPPPGRILDFRGKTLQATAPQLLADYGKAALLTEDERRRLQAGQEALTRSREIDEFCRRHRADPRIQNFLREFYSLPSSPSVDHTNISFPGSINER